MFVIISPAKKLKEENPVGPAAKIQVGGDSVQTSKPDFIAETRELHKYLTKLGPADIMKLMGISRQLGELNHQRHQALFSSPEYCAGFLFQGDTYQGLRAEEFTGDELRQAQKCLRILSGLYGLLRPLDLISPYRLEMGSSLATAQGKNLYEFWGDKLSKELVSQMDKAGDKILVNLASSEYAKVVLGNKDLFKQAGISVITPQFYDKPLGQAGKPGGEFKVIGFLAKKARGAMARFIIQNKPSKVAELADFNWDGYGFDPAASNELQPIFRRDRTRAA